MLLSKAYEIRKNKKMVIVGPQASPSQLRYVGISPALIHEYQVAKEAYEAFVGNIEAIRTYSTDDDVTAKELQLFKGQQEALDKIEKALTAKARATKKNERAKAWQREHKDKQRVFVAHSQARKYVKAYATKEELNCLKDLINQRLNELN